MSDSPRALLDRCRHPNRLRSSHLIGHVVSNFQRLPSPDAALICGTGTIEHQNVLIFAQEKPQGRDARLAAATNYGMMTATGYWYVVEQLERVARTNQAVLLLIDTPGADPSKHGAENLLAWSISACVRRLLTHDGPTVSVLLGEGGSGGALALQVADRRLMVDDAIYSVISPESCSAILFRSTDHVDKAMGILRPSAEDVLKTGIMDEIVHQPNEAMVKDHAAAAKRLGEAITAAFRHVNAIAPAKRTRLRGDQYVACGKMVYTPSAPKVAATVHKHGGDNQAPPFPKLDKFKRITRNEGETSALRDAYFRAKVGHAPQEVEDILCPQDQGGCGTLMSEAAFVQAGWACPRCHRGERLTSDHWIALLCGGLPFEELYADLDLSDLHHAGYDNDSYRQLRAKTREELGIGESLRVGVGYVEDMRCALAISDFRFFGGTLGAAAGEKLFRICQVAREEHLPLVSVTCSGGVRMQDGTLGLAQMAKSVAAVNLLMESNLSYVSILADPCTGGALGSYSTVAHSILAEPQALVAFAGPRVMRLAGLPVNEASLVSDRYVEYSGVDESVPRRRLRSCVLRYLHLKPVPRRRWTGAIQAVSAEPHLKEITGWFDGLVARVSGALQDYQDAAANTSTMVHNQATIVSLLADLALMSVPFLLEQAARSTNHRVRANAVEALARFPAQDATHLRMALSDTHHRVRANAILGLLRQDPKNDEARASLEQLLVSPDAVHRRAGLWALACEPVHDYGPRLRAMCEDEDVETAICAAAALFGYDDVAFARSCLGPMLDKVGHPAERRARKMLQVLPDKGGQELAAFLADRNRSP